MKGVLTNCLRNALSGLVDDDSRAVISKDRPRLKYAISIITDLKSERNIRHLGSASAVLLEAFTWMRRVIGILEFNLSVALSIAVLKGARFA
jgi:hypothetical protein